MRIQTSNKLAHLQAEFIELSQQTVCLENQVEPLKVQISRLEQYLSINNGDRKISSQYKKSCRSLHTLYNKINRNKTRLMTLQMNIDKESFKASTGM